MLTSLVVALSLAVPYLPQTEALCGGAAAAMVFRYWGDVHADIEAFAPLVDKRAGGIADDVLINAIEERGWRSLRFSGSVETLSEQIQNGRPVVILIHDRGSLFHYLVVTGVETDAVIVHDPTWGPSRRIALPDLMRVWRPADFWSLVILPGPARGDEDQAPATNGPLTVRPENTSCDRMLDTAIDEAAKTPEQALGILDGVRVRCPGAAGPLREMAGVQFAARRWREAAAYAERAAAVDATDRYTWDLLASSRFMQDDFAGTLQAWNQIGKPLVNLVRIDGLSNTRFQLIAAVMDLRPNMVLTEGAFRLADRRLQDLPGQSAARLTFRPEPDGYVTVTAALVERSGPPRTAAAWTATGIQTAIEREARVNIPGPTGQGEMWSAGWRWWRGRPRVALGFAAPQTGALRGVWRVDASWESQTYAAGGLDAHGAAGSFDESRAHVGLSLSDWIGANHRYSVSAGADSWRGPTHTGRTAFAGGSFERRWQNDRWSLLGTGTAWFPAPFSAAGVRAAFRSSRSAEGWVYLADAGVERASDSAPLAIWPGAGEGHSRLTLLRAHPLLDSGAIDLERQSAFGRTLAYSHAEAQRWIASGAPVRFGVAAFADLAAASRRSPPAGRGPTQIDLGTGLRVRIPGAAAGTLRVDFAHGLRDGANAVTFGWQF